MLKPVDLEDGWSATPTWVAPHGYILVVTLSNGTGRVERDVRFDAGKLMFLDRRPGVPEFDTATKQRLARSVSR